MRRPGRLGVAGAAVGLLLVGAALALLTGDRQAPTAPTADEVPVTAAPAELAEQACAYVTQELPAQVARDAPAEEVLAGIDRTARLTRAAADRDAAYVPLASGVAALREALQHDDPDATDIALRVVVNQCAR